MSRLHLTRANRAHETVRRSSLGTNDENRIVEQEANQYGDIIQIDQVDYYYHNSCKLPNVSMLVTGRDGHGPFRAVGQLSIDETNDE
jgi:hypothetical protein